MIQTEEKEPVAAEEIVENLRDGSPSEFEEYVVRVKRCSKVVKGGRRLSFSAVVVVGDRRGRIGFGLGKANEVADAIRKGGDLARKTLFRVKMQGDTIPHEAIGKFSASRVLLRPAPSGSGIIAGGGVRALLNLSGIRNVVAKSLGSNDKLNVIHATVDALRQLRTLEESRAIRGSAG